MALDLFKYQYANNEVYKRFTDSINVDAEAVDTIEKIPFLPIDFFKKIHFHFYSVFVI